jgi:tripartite-type tricarboxylate transporter receptor subunit TctC
MTARATVLALAGLVMACAAGAWAQSYPERSLRQVLGFPAGGTPDALARAVATQVSAQLGRNIVVDNRAGANGIIAAEIVAKAPPDGYTLLFSPPALLINQIIYPKLQYEVLRDFVPVVNVCLGEGSLLVVHPSVPVHTVEELIAISKQDKSLTYGSPGVGNTQHLISELFNLHSGARLRHVPYKGLPPAVNAVLSGEVNVLFAPPAIIVQHIKAGRLRVLGFTGANRWPVMPDVPTIAESGVPGFEVAGSWQGWFAPVRTPDPIVQRLHSEVAKAILQPKVRDFIKSAGYEPDGRSPSEFRTLIAADLKRYTEVVRVANIKAE